MILWPLLAAVIASTAALLASLAMLLLRGRAERAAMWIVPFGIGTLSAAATLHILPEALETLPADRTMLLFLTGILLFIAFERAMQRHETHHHGVSGATASVLLWGDALHNFLDGVVIGVAFGAGTNVGIVATVAVFAHELPQEIADFAVLLKSGMSRRRALLLNYASALPIIPGAAAAVVWTSTLTATARSLLPVAAGAFVYIALADLVPPLHHQRGRGVALVQLLLVALGAVTIWLLRHVGV